MVTSLTGRDHDRDHRGGAGRGPRTAGGPSVDRIRLPSHEFGRHCRQPLDRMMGEAKLVFERSAHRHSRVRSAARAEPAADGRALRCRPGCRARGSPPSATGRHPARGAAPGQRGAVRRPRDRGRAVSFDHLVGTQQDRGRDRDAEILRGVQIHGQHELRGQHDRQLGHFGALEDAVDVFAPRHG